MDQPADQPITSLRRLADAEATCTRCPLYKDATQAVPGEGPSRAAFMLVGEQPGDKEISPASRSSVPRAAYSTRR
jgi:DNA polymerase